MSGKIYYKKLVRDNIPDEIAAWGGECETRPLSEKDFKKELRRKVAEEASAVPVAESKEKLIDELADLHIVVKALCESEEISKEDIDHAVATNMQRKGGFSKRLFLEWSSDTGYKTNEKTQ